MTSYKFEVAAKNAVMDVVLKNHDEVFTIKDLSLVWFARILGNMKAIVIDNGVNNRLYEVTYNIDKDEMYVDEYDKQTNTVFYSGMIDTEVR